MVERQSEHRMSQESRLVDARTKQTDRAQWMCFVFVLAILGIAYQLGMAGHYWLAGILATTTISAILGAFLLRTASPTSPSTTGRGKGAEGPHSAPPASAARPAPKKQKKGS